MLHQVEEETDRKLELQRKERQEEISSLREEKKKEDEENKKALQDCYSKSNK